MEEEEKGQKSKECGFRRGRRRKEDDLASGKTRVENALQEVTRIVTGREVKNEDST